MSKCYQQVQLTINHDWTKTKSVVNNIISIDRTKLEQESYGQSEHYSLKSLGVLSVHSLSNCWYRVVGPVVNRTMPWLTELLDTMKELNPDDGAISYMIGNGGEHIDLPHMSTALNYIFDNTDALAYTWVNNVGKETYSSDIGTAWILNTQLPHGIVNNGNRWALSIHFDQDYNTVAEWFNRHPNLIFGKI